MTDKEKSRYILVAETGKSQNILYVTFNISQISDRHVTSKIEEICLMWEGHYTEYIFTDVTKEQYQVYCKGMTVKWHHLIHN